MESESSQQGVQAKRRFPRLLGLTVARELCQALEPVCSRLVVAGSLRRRKEDVGDVEILFVGLTERRPDPKDMFGELVVDLAEERIETLLADGVLFKRLNVRGGTSWGDLNKLAVHARSEIPVDLFTATEANWWNYLVCRTGPAESNQRIAERAQAKGWKWNPYGVGFTEVEGGRVVAMESEQQVFAFVGLPFQTPEGRR